METPQNIMHTQLRIVLGNVVGQRYGVSSSVMNKLKGVPRGSKVHTWLSGRMKASCFAVRWQDTS